MVKKHGHYCKVCGECKSNESFSGSGHAAHICKKCVALPAAQRSEEMILTKPWNLPWQLSTQQRDWLKGLQNDSRPEVASTAKELYADRFPYAARNARKKQLHILRMEFSVCGEVIDEYGDVCYEDIQFTLDRKAHTVALRQENKTAQITLTEKDMRKLLNVIVNNYEVFCWEDDYGFSDTGNLPVRQVCINAGIACQVYTKFGTKPVIPKNPLYQKRRKARQQQDFSHRNLV